MDNKKYRPLNEVFKEQTPYHFIFELAGESIGSTIDRVIGCIMIPTCINENIVKFSGLINGHSTEFDIRYIEDVPNFILKTELRDINVVSFKYQKLEIDIKFDEKFKSNKTLISNPLIDHEKGCFNIDILKHAIGKKCLVKYIYKDIEHEEILDFHSFNTEKTELKFYNNGSIVLLFNINMPHIEDLEIYELKKLGTDKSESNDEFISSDKALTQKI